MAGRNDTALAAALQVMAQAVGAQCLTGPFMTFSDRGSMPDRSYLTFSDGDLCPDGTTCILHCRVDGMLR